MRPNLTSLKRRLPFLRWGAFGSYTGLNTIGSVQSAASLDYTALSGEALENSVVAACINAIAQALPDAPLYLEHRTPNGWHRLDDHPLLDLLRRPNPYHSQADLWGATVAMERTRGQAFWYLETANGTPQEIWYVASERVQLESTTDNFISGYLITSETGQQVHFENSQVIHFRHQMHPLAPRLGWTPLQSGQRQLAGDNLAATYHSAILKNSGVLSLLITLKDGASAGEVTPGQLEAFTSKLKGKLFGEGAGAVAGLDLPLDVHKLSYSPDEMALDRLINYYESRICALLGVDPMVAGLGSGTAQKTYANLAEALSDFWQRQIIPLRNRHAATLQAQLLPLFEPNPHDWRLKFDFSQVAALQENLDALHTRVRADYQAHLIDLQTARQKLDYGGDELTEFQYQGVFYGDKTQNDELKLWDETKHPRDQIGRWTNGGAGQAMMPVAHSDIINPPKKRLNPSESAEAAFQIMLQAHEHIKSETKRLDNQISQLNIQLNGYVDQGEFESERAKRDTKLYAELYEERRTLYDRVNAEVATCLFVEHPAELEYTATFSLDDRRFTAATTGVDFALSFVSSALKLQPVNFEPAPKANSRSDYVPSSHVPSKGRVRLTERAGTVVVVHELGHNLERENPQVHEKAVDFLKRRAGTEELRPLKEEHEDYGDNEVAWKDDFTQMYMGKYYPGYNATEIISMGMEYFMNDPIKLAVEDQDYFMFIYNVLRGQ